MSWQVLVMLAATLVLPEMTDTDKLPPILADTNPFFTPWGSMHHTTRENTDLYTVLLLGGVLAACSRASSGRTSTPAASGPACCCGHRTW